MKKGFLTGALTVATGVAVTAASVFQSQTTPPPTIPNQNLFDYKVSDIKGKSQELSQYKGKVVLVVNVASKCGNTPQYEGLQALYLKYKDRGLVVLGFPCNQFNGQEPGTNADILEFCEAKYNVTFPMFDKIEVKGKDASQIYRHLVHSTENKSDIEWNFTKFIVGKDGSTIARYSPKTLPSDENLVSKIEELLSD